MDILDGIECIFNRRTYWFFSAEAVVSLFDQEIEVGDSSAPICRPGKKYEAEVARRHERQEGGLACLDVLFASVVRSAVWVKKKIYIQAGPRGVNLRLVYTVGKRTRGNMAFDSVIRIVLMTRKLGRLPRPSSIKCRSIQTHERIRRLTYVSSST